MLLLQPQLFTIHGSLESENEVKDLNGENLRILRHGKRSNVFIAFADDRIHADYIIKNFSTYELFLRELEVLKKFEDSKHIVKFLNYYPESYNIIYECAFYSLENYIGHHIRLERDLKSTIITDIASGLLELQSKEIVHLKLSPGNIMFFSKYSKGCWKLIDFGNACTVYDVVKIVPTNYSSPEVLRAHDENISIKAHFAMDMFSFGMILMFIETGVHYWDGKDQDIRQTITSSTEIQNSKLNTTIKRLIDKNISSRMILAQFMKDFGSIRPKSCDIPGRINFDRDNSLFLDFNFVEEPYDMRDENMDKLINNQVKILDGINRCVNAVQDLSRKIPQWLVKLKNEPIPRIFVIIPERTDWKNPQTWCAQTFKLYFVCEHEDHWHVPKQEPYKLVKVPGFIKKYGFMTLFPPDLVNLFTDVFGIKNGCDLLHYFNDVVDTIERNVFELPDSEPEFMPLDTIDGSLSVINGSGLHALKKYIDIQNNPDHYGNLVRCVHKDDEVLWICEKHRDKYTTKSLPPTLSLPLSPPLDSSLSSPSSLPSPSSLSSPLPPPSSLLPPSPLPSPPPLTSPPSPYSKIESMVEIPTMDQIYKVYRVLSNFIEGVEESERKHFKIKEIKNIGQKMRESMDALGKLYPKWDNIDQKKMLIDIAESHAAIYIRLLRLVVRYRFVVDMNTQDALKNIKARALQAQYLAEDYRDINRNYWAAKDFNGHLGKLVNCMRKVSDERNCSSMVKQVLEEFEKSKKLYDKLCCREDHEMNRWYKSKLIRTIDLESIDQEYRLQSDLVNLFRITKYFLNHEDVVGYTLRDCNSVRNLECMEKAIHLYDRFELNRCENIVAFRGCSFLQCKPILIFEWPNKGDLFNYLKQNNNSTLFDWKRKMKMVWEITSAVKFLHENDILHLDLRSSNVFLFQEETELVAKVGNFLWSKSLIESQTSVMPKPLGAENSDWKRWHDPQRLIEGKKHICKMPCDIYGLGLLLWEIAQGTGVVPYKDVKITDLSKHLRNESFENVTEYPKDPEWSKTVKSMCAFNPSDRPQIELVYKIIDRLYNEDAE
ncbi:7945_t:CDS:10 [Acaulospora morrowiae]|uniref:7945_t:CDS:1 n=1 Tax=Acaulospora morrowiae TaxID=94023 RepID=A0A9N9BGM6_9GLOM|nr:7945_t:CDS:10 [Acaulospora morrowiae]